MKKYRRINGVRKHGIGYEAFFQVGFKTFWKGSFTRKKDAVAWHAITKLKELRKYYRTLLS